MKSISLENMEARDLHAKQKALEWNLNNKKKRQELRQFLHYIKQMKDEGVPPPKDLHEENAKKHADKILEWEVEENEENI